MEFLKPILPYSLHFIAPGLIGYIYNKTNWKRNWLVLISTMLIDLDHLAANPIFDPNRCSYNYHFLHTDLAIAIYMIGLLFKHTKLLSIGLIFHILTDVLDCCLK